MTKDEAIKITSTTHRLIDFNPDTHEYFVDGIKRPSVSDLIAPISALVYGSAKPSFFAMKAIELGSRVHKAIEAYETMGIVSEEEDVIPYLNTYIEWRSSTDYELIACETRLLGNGFCGTADLLFWQPKWDYITLVDIKTGSSVSESLWETQLEFYRMALRSMGLACRTAYVLKLDGKGGFRIYPKDIMAPSITDELIRIYEWRRMKGEA